MLHSEAEAYRAGIAARKGGQPKDDNPYKRGEGRNEWLWWNIGWQSTDIVSRPTPARKDATD